VGRTQRRPQRSGCARANEDEATYRDYTVPIATALAIGFDALLVAVQVVLHRPKADDLAAGRGIECVGTVVKSVALDPSEYRPFAGHRVLVRVPEGEVEVAAPIRQEPGTRVKVRYRRGASGDLYGLSIAPVTPPSEPRVKLDATSEGVQP
jgi:hypothetical protein